MTERLPHAALLVLLSACAMQAPEQKPAPNVVLIAVDDLNDWVGALGGHPQAKTPNIDRLAARGMLFRNAHCQAPVCSPSRASLATGRLPSSTGMYFLTPSLAQEPSLQGCVTLTQRFAAEGYATYGVGKIHHGNERPFFQDYGGGMGGFGPRPKQKLSYPIGHPLWDWGAYPESDAQMPDTRVADWAIERLQRPHAAPFLLAVGFYRPHVPMYAPKPWFDLHPREATALPEVFADDRSDLSAYAKQLTIGLPAPRHSWFVEERQWQHAVQAYLASVSFVDACVGRVLDALEQSPHADNTIVVLFSDHGFHLGEKQRWAKRSLWETSTRVPLIIAAPQRAPGACAQPVSLLDIYPTLLDLCLVEPDAALDGHSLKPLLQDPEAAWPHHAITTFGPGNHAVRSRDWRYIRYGDGSEELYDHRSDPNEWHNLTAIADPPADLAEVLAAHRRALPKADAPVRAGAEKSSGYRAFAEAERLR